TAVKYDGVDDPYGQYDDKRGDSQKLNHTRMKRGGVNNEKGTIPIRVQRDTVRELIGTGGILLVILSIILRFLLFTV
ncbi:MAG: hypothetical protein WCS55_04050, partial [Sulfuricurvum sp.]|uniref:hypothetical protein n=1 Tax=Sulfuricurvum sp. TaxID=2025608 RepID=UPI0035666159